MRRNGRAYSRDRSGNSNQDQAIAEQNGTTLEDTRDRRRQYVQLKGAQVDHERSLQFIRRLGNTSSKGRRNRRNHTARIQRLGLHNSLPAVNTISANDLVRIVQSNLRYNRRSRRIMTHRNPYNSINRQTRRSILIRRIRVSTSNNGSLSSQQSLTIMRMSPSGQNRSTKSNMKRRMTRARADSVLSRRQISSSNRHRYNSSRSQRLGRNMSRRPTGTKPRITKDGGVLRILRSCRFVSRLTATVYTATLNSLARRTKVSNPSSKRSRRRDR